MCIAILQTKNSRIKKKTLKTCFENNPDSIGMMWIEDNKIRLFKELHCFDLFYANYLEICNRVGKKSNVVLHFRIATHGSIDLKNCHPHMISKNIGFVHNGIISIETNGLESDTVAFNKTILKTLPFESFQAKGLFELIDGYGFDSKFIFLDINNQYTVIGKGTWKKGIWYSNDSYKYRRVKVFKTSTIYPKVIDKNTTHDLHDDGLNNPYYYEGEGYPKYDYKDYWTRENLDKENLDDENLDDITQEEMEMVYLQELQEMEKADRLEHENLTLLARDEKKNSKELDKFLISKVNDIRKKLNGKFQK